MVVCRELKFGVVILVSSDKVWPALTSYA